MNREFKPSESVSFAQNRSPFSSPFTLYGAKIHYHSSSNHLKIVGLISQISILIYFLHKWLNPEEIKQIEQIADATSAAGTAADTGVAVLSLISASDSTSACMGPIAKMLQYIQFMNISFPEKVQLMMDQQNENARSEGFTQKMLGETLDEFPNHELPKRFEMYRMPSSFFVNFWPTLFNLLVILLVTFAVMILASQTKGSPKINGVLQNITEALKWNVTLIMFCGCLGDVVFFTALELQTMQFDNFAAVFSFLLCLFINFLAIFVVVKILEINLLLRKSKRTNVSETEKVEKQWCSYKAFFECYRDGSYSQQIFLFVFIMRSALFNGMIGYLYQYPVFQAVIFTLSNILMLAYLLIKRPMRKLVNLLQQITLELALLPFNFCVLILAIMDKQGVKAFDQRKSLGNVILYINIAVPFISLALMAAKVIAIGIELYKQKKANQLNKLKKFSVEISRQTNTTLNTTAQEMLPSQTLPSPSYLPQSTVPMENMQVLDLADSVYFSRSPETSLNFSNLGFSPALQRTRRPRFHQQDLILPDLPQEPPRGFLQEDSPVFQGLHYVTPALQNQRGPLVRRKQNRIRMGN